MTFEERIDRLTERHEALSQTVEHLARENEEGRAQLAQQSINIDRVLKIVELLAKVVQSHDERLDDLQH